MRALRCVKSLLQRSCSTDVSITYLPQVNATHCSKFKISLTLLQYRIAVVGAETAFRALQPLQYTSCSTLCTHHYVRTIRLGVARHKVIHKTTLLGYTDTIYFYKQLSRETRQVTNVLSYKHINENSKTDIIVIIQTIIKNLGTVCEI